jgi:hypothetical protein
MATPTITPDALKTTIEDIISVNTFLNDFWGDGGWASGDARRLLRESRLDRQVELSRTLAIWLEPPTEHDSDGRLILAWANLGTLVEGTMKWFLCVFANDYANAPEFDRNGNRVDPDDIWFAKLCRYFVRQVGQTAKFDRLCSRIRARRNSIHAFTDRPIGTWDEWYECVIDYRRFLIHFALSVPYPDEQFAMPFKIREIEERVSLMDVDKLPETTDEYMEQ